MEVLNQKEFKVTDEMLADNGSRFANLIIDRIAQTIIIFVFAAIIAFIFSIIGYNEGLVWMDNISNITDIVISLLFLLIYYMAFEMLFGKTVGKFITKTSVVLENGEKPSNSEIFIRTFCRIVPFEPFSFLSDKGNGWHDRWSETYVVKDTVFQEHKTAYEEFDELGNSFED